MTDDKPKTYFDWSEELKVGVEKIDQQHAEIIKAVNSMLDAMSRRKGKEQLNSLINFLETYAVEHFDLEEYYMVRFGYEGYTEHKEKHEKFKVEFAALKGRLDEEGASTHLVIQTQNWLIEWLRDHIRNVDKDMAKFLKPRIMAEECKKRVEDGG